MSGVTNRGCSSWDDQQKKTFLHLKNRSSIIRPVLDLIPTAIAIWSPDRLFCILNRAASDLIGFSDRDFKQDPSLWTERIHPQDRELFSTAWTKLLGGETTTSSDYRFAPKGSAREIWLRDMSVSYQGPQGEIETVTSSLTDISNLKLHSVEGPKDERGGYVSEIIDGIVHEIQNNLQVMSLGCDLLRLDRSQYQESQPIINCIERTKKFVQELREYFLPPSTHFSMEDPGVILEEVVRELEKELAGKGIRLRMIRSSPLPWLSMDGGRLRAALDRVLKFSCALLPKGGELEIEARLREEGTQRHVVLSIGSCSPHLLGLEEKDVFQPFTRLHSYDAGLSLALAREVLRRHNGELLFKKKGPERSEFTILLKAASG